jgi:transmembrane sensor
MEISSVPDSRESAEEAASSFIARRESGAWTDADAAALEQWLAESVGHRAAYYRLNAGWERLGRLKALGADRGLGPEWVADQAPPATLDQRVPPRHRARPGVGSGRRHRRLWAAAASLALLAVGLYTWHTLGWQRDRYATPIGATETLPLADGSRVLLNTNSAIHIAFSPSERRVDLEQGEAYFEVAHDQTRPFVVKVGGERVIAVGTQFAVRQDGAVLRVSVTQGTVRLARGESPLAAAGQLVHSPGGSPGDAAQVLLPAGSIARVESQAVLVQRRPVSEVEQSLSWRSGILTFRDTPLAEAVAEFNRYNTRRIVIRDSALANLQVGGIFRATKIDPFVHLLQQGLPVEATVENDTIMLSERH